jgi:thiol-disulfide isomerase/thioredoxin
MSTTPKSPIFRVPHISLLRCGILATTLLAAALPPAHTQQTAASPNSTAADDILTQARTQASAEHKNILLVFSASWCGPCHEFDAFMKDPSTGPIMLRYFVPASVDVGEEARGHVERNAPGGEKLMVSLAGGHNEGYPLIVLLTPQGSPIVNSLINGHHTKNIGYPHYPQEIAWFMSMLQQSTPSMTTAETKTIHEWLQKRGHS